MPATYEPIATTTLGSAAADITFTSIPGTYTDLRLVVVGRCTAAGVDTQGMYLQFNGNTATNYSNTQILGNGSSAISDYSNNNSIMQCGELPAGNISTSIFALNTADIFSYTGSTNKTVLVTSNADMNTGTTASRVWRLVGLWRQTSAITSIKVYPSGSNFDTGTTATLYGILKA